ncbi:TIGR02679 family protein [Nocardia asteroides]|uniref:TIGR02679 family protein n=1 Tax=Nocardia asteroides TaxID=1824 RepID=UPI001E427D0A|nr:TIGR02679 family protein [Nocardia asteroides]UGT60871.1 TIGR02679 family protein [Nocardia asteroides]
MPLPPRTREYLAAPSLAEFWAKLRERLERTGHAITGTVRVDVDSDAAEKISGLLGRRVTPGRRTVAIFELDAALRQSAAGSGLVTVLAELTGGPLRDRPSERLARTDTVTALWAEVERVLDDTGLAAAPWIEVWKQWLHGTGLLLRTPETGRAEFATAAKAVATALDHRQPSRMLGQLATDVAGDSHALDGDRLAGRLAIRALSLAFDRPDPLTARDRSTLWQLAGITVDAVSGTVLTWGLRPPGRDQWSAMLRTRTELGLVTHLTLAELAAFPLTLTAPEVTVAACENPQVLQGAAERGVPAPLICFSGNPSAAGIALAERVRIRYHGDFDWPGIGIAARLHAIGAEPWRMSAADYLAAIDSGIHRLPLTGQQVPTPWDPELSSTMHRTGLIVHEESLLDVLLADLR